MRSVMAGSAWRRSLAMRHAYLVGMLVNMENTSKLTRMSDAEGLRVCRGLEMTVHWCVDGLRLVERPELVGDLAFDGWDGVS